MGTMAENPINMLSGLPDVAIQGYDRDRRVLYWNDASTDLYGYTVEEALGRRLEDLISPADMVDAMIREIGVWLAGGPPPSGGQICLRHKNGHLVNVHSNHLSLRDETDRPRLYCIDIPVDRLDGVEATLDGVTRLDRTGQDPTANRDSAMSHGFLASLSHEVRTPLNAILGFSELLALRFGPVAGDAAESEYLAHIRKAGQDLTHVLEQSLALLGSAPSVLNPRPRTIQVQDVLIEVASVVLAHRPDRDDLVTVNRVPADLRTMADPFLLKHALAALARYALSNSIGGEAITLAAESRTGITDMVLFQVEDSGPPLPDALRMRLLSGHAINTNPYRSENQSGLFHLSIAQRVALATGALLSFERTPARTNRTVLGVRAAATPDADTPRAKRQ